MTYQELDSMLGNRESRRLYRTTSTGYRIYYHNTRIERQQDGSIAVRLYYTDIMRFYRRGHICLDTGGHTTATTKNRMNDLLPQPWRISQRDFQWYLKRGWDDEGRRFGSNGQICIERDLAISATSYTAGLIGHPHPIPVDVPLPLDILSGVFEGTSTIEVEDDDDYFAGV